MPLDNLAVQSDPKFPLFRGIDFFGGSVSWDTQPNGLDSFSKATDPFPPLLFDFFTVLLINVSVSGLAFFDIFLLATAPLSTTSFRTLKFRVLLV